MQNQYIPPPDVARYNVNYNNQDRGGPQPNYWSQATQQKSKYYDDLTSYLLIIFSVVCIARAIAIGIETSKTMSCPTITTNQIINVVNYALWVVLFLASFAAIKAKNIKLLWILFVLCWVNLLFKLIVTGLIGFTNDLLGNCFLTVHYKTWVWVFGLLETFLFAFLTMRIKTVISNLSSYAS